MTFFSAVVAGYITQEGHRCKPERECSTRKAGFTANARINASRLKIMRRLSEFLFMNMRWSPLNIPTMPGHSLCLNPQAEKQLKDRHFLITNHCNRATGIVEKNN
jgi:hypothetical protein